MADDDIIDLCDDDELNQTTTKRTLSTEPLQARKRQARGAEQANDCILIDDEEDDAAPAAAPMQLGTNNNNNNNNSNNRLHGEASYVLDTCGCELAASHLQSHVLCLASPAAAALPPTPSARQLLVAWRCPKCKAAISHRDVRQLAGASATQRMYMTLCREVLPLPGKPQQPQQVTTAAEGFPCPCCASDKGGQASVMVPVERLRQHGTQPGTNSTRPSLTHAQLKKALSARNLSCRGSSAALAARLLSHLEEAAASASYMFCLGCDAIQASPDTLDPPAAETTSGRSSGHTTGLDNQASTSLPTGIDNILVSLVAGLYNQLLASEHEGSSAAARGNKKAKPIQRGSAAPRGTGYGGEDVSDRVTGAAVSAAAARQDKADKALQQTLDQIRQHLSQGGTSAPGAAHVRHAGCSSVAFTSFYLPGTAALVLAGPMPHLLRLLLQNDSLQDIASRQQLYRSLAGLLRTLQKSQDLVEVFTVCTDSPDEQAKAEAQGQGSAGPSASSAADTTLLALLQRLNTQCMVYRRTGEELGQGDEEDIAALSMALEWSTLYDDVAEAVQAWTSAVGVEEAPANLHAGQQAGPSGSGAATAAAGDKKLTSRAARRQAAVAALVAADDAALQQRQAKYLQTMRPMLFREVPLKDHYFRKSLVSAGSSGNEMVRKRLRRITEEIATLSTSLPLAWDSSIWVAVDTERMDVLRAMVMPASDTPYAMGFFVFDILLPPEYPNQPPMVQFLTTGGGKVRFNPNLYHDGKVCLSLLGTWSGPSWQPGTSTLLQVLISIHALILVSDPWFNEPGFEGQLNTSAGKQASDKYNEQVRLDTLNVALLPALQLTAAAHAAGGPVSCKASLPGWATFKDAIMAHCLAKQAEIKALCQEWLAGSSTTFKGHMQAVVTKVEDSLKLLADQGQAAC